MVRRLEMCIVRFFSINFLEEICVSGEGSTRVSRQSESSSCLGLSEGEWFRSADVIRVSARLRAVIVATL